MGFEWNQTEAEIFNRSLTDSTLEKGKPSQMSKNRLEAFSDGVFAAIITIMVLDMKVPQGTDLHALKSVVPVFLCYVLSYVYVGIYWNNHHHLLHASERVSGGILWAHHVQTGRETRSYGSPTRLLDASRISPAYAVNPAAGGQGSRAFLREPTWGRFIPLRRFRRCGSSKSSRHH